MRLMFAVLIALAAPSFASAQVNLTGTWQPKYWTMKMALQQEGDRVWGHGGAQDFWFRGHWDGARLIIVANNFDPERPKSPCRPRGVMAVAGTTVSNLVTAKNNQALRDRRAATVKTTLVQKYGADAARITTKGWGADQAVGENTTEDGKALNRRVEIVLNWESAWPERVSV